ncbi:hypothetical protein [Shewanella algae]|uniref:hypothetical protein n=1 Tax=Shewanella algae TaxID=38313 RepID=UPI00313B3CF7
MSIELEMDIDELEEFNFDSMDEDLAEIDRLYGLVDEAFEWWGVFLDLQYLTEQFQNDLRSLKLGVIIPKEQTEKDNSFLYGTLLSGVISLYEGFVHDLLEVCLNKDDFMNNAVANISRLDSKDQGYLKIRKNGSGEELRGKLKKATLHDPIQIARIVNALFKLPFPRPRDEFIIKVLEIRNAFTHNNGKLNGEKISLSVSDFLFVFHFFDSIVAAYLDKLVKSGNDFMELNK